MRVGLFLTAIAVSLVVAFATGGFWVKLRPTVSQARVHYTYDALLLFEVRSNIVPCAHVAQVHTRFHTCTQGQTAGEERMWSTSSTINSQFASKFIAASVQVGSGLPSAASLII